MRNIEFISYKGKKILIEDFSNVKPGPEFFDGLKQAQSIIASQPPKSVLAVFDVTGCSFNGELLNAMKEFTKANTPYIKAATVIGINGLLEVAQSAIAKFSGRPFHNFKTRDEAMEWLILQ